MSKGFCADCPFHWIEGGAMWCRRWPPTFYERVNIDVAPIMTAKGETKRELIKDMASSFPPVLRDWWCGEHPTRRAWAELKGREDLPTDDRVDRQLHPSG